MVSRVLSGLVRLWRLTALVVAGLLLHHASRALPDHGVASLADARSFFPAAESLHSKAAGLQEARDADERTLGFLVQTSPAADRITGYAGPSNLLVAVNEAGHIVGTKILQSADTQVHVEALTESAAFAKSLLGWHPALEPAPKVEGIGGSTLTGLAMVEGIAQRLSGSHGSLRFPEVLTIAEAREMFPSAAQLRPDDPRSGWTRVTDVSGALAGYLVRTSPASDSLLGYAGPTECLVALEPDQQTLRKIHIRKSYDTDDYVGRIVEDGEYLKSLTRWKVAEWPAMDLQAKKIEGVAGATMTSFAIADGLRERFKADAAPRAASSNRPALKDIALCLFICGATVAAFTPLRGYRWFRVLWQAGLIAGLGLWLGQFLSLGLLAGWAGSGVSLGQASPLLLLGVVALLVPWAGRRQVYCHQICPHGAAQEWLGHLPLRKFQVPARWHAVLRTLPGVLLCVAFGCALLRPKTGLGNFEPFDFWILGTGALIPAALALGGLLLSVKVPMAYCRYGCPTGALLSFVRSASERERFGRRDGIAAIVLTVAFFGVTFQKEPESRPKLSEPVAFRGSGFGTTWCIKIRRGASAVSLHDRLAAEVERIEATLSHWRVGSATSTFNASRSTQPQRVPEELVDLVSIAQNISRATGGAYDVTVGPLVSAWGYGPERAAGARPSDSEIAALRERVGWEKLRIGEDHTSLQKLHPELSLDLGSILQGYAVDRLCGILDEAGCEEYLVEVGGELRARGNWRVAIENPADAQRPLQQLDLQDEALATSGLARARKRLSGSAVSHIISPLTGRPVEPSIEVSSVARPTCLEADGWSTAVIAAGLSMAEKVAREHGLKAWVQETSGTFRKLE